MKENNKKLSPSMPDVSEVGRELSLDTPGAIERKIVQQSKTKQLRFGFGKLKRSRSFTMNSKVTNTEITRSVKFWHVRSNVRETAMLRFLRVKFFWGLISDPTEVQFCFDHPKFLSDVEFNVLLSLRVNTELTREEITERSKAILLRIGKKSNFQFNLVKQWENNVLVIADLNERPILKRKSFSGWVRSASSVGSKKSVLTKPEAFSIEVFDGDKFDDFNFLYQGILKGYLRSNSLTISLGKTRKSLNKSVINK